MGNIDAGQPPFSGFKRKYLTNGERRRALVAAAQLTDEKRLFIEMLTWCGGRISEVLALTPGSFDLELNSVSLATLKRRKPSARHVPLPPFLVRNLDAVFQLRRRQHLPDAMDQRLWNFHRTTGWRIVKDVMACAKIAGAQARPHGLRHGFGVGALQAGVPLTLLKRWMGHAKLTSTEIYLDVIGPEERHFAFRFWSATAPRTGGRRCR